MLLHANELVSLRVQNTAKGTCFFCLLQFFQISAFKLFNPNRMFACLSMHRIAEVVRKPADWTRISPKVKKTSLCLPGADTQYWHLGRKTDQFWLEELAVMRQKSGLAWSVAPSCVGNSGSCNDQVNVATSMIHIYPIFKSLSFLPDAKAAAAHLQWIVFPQVWKWIKETIEESKVRIRNSLSRCRKVRTFKDSLKHP